MKNRVSERGQITIPKNLRDRFGLHQGVEVEFVVEGGVLRLSKAKAGIHPVRRVFGVLEKQSSTDEYLEEIRGR